MTIKTKLIRISSEDRLTDSSSSSSNFKVAFPNVQALSRCVSVILKHASFPNTVYNIKSTNNTFKYNDGADQTLVIPVGFYSVSQLLTYLGTYGPPILYTQDPASYKILFDNAVAPTNYIIYDSANGSTIAPLLGITSNLNIPIGGSAYAQNLPSLEGLKHLYVGSKALSKGNNMIFGNARQEVDILAMLPVTEPFGSIVHYETPHENLEIVNFDGETNIQNIDITLYNGEGDIIDLNGGFFHMILKVFYRI